MKGKPTKPKPEADEPPQPHAPDLDHWDWVDLTWNVFDPDSGCLISVLKEEAAKFGVYCTDREPTDRASVFAFRSRDGEPRLLHAATKSIDGWVCCCGLKPCLATALLTVWEAVQPFVSRRR